MTNLPPLRLKTPAEYAKDSRGTWLDRNGGKAALVALVLGTGTCFDGAVRTAPSRNAIQAAVCAPTYAAIARQVQDSLGTNSADSAIAYERALNAYSLQHAMNETPACNEDGRAQMRYVKAVQENPPTTTGDIEFLAGAGLVALTFAGIGAVGTYKYFQK